MEPKTELGKGYTGRRNVKKLMSPNSKKKCFEKEDVFNTLRGQEEEK